MGYLTYKFRAYPNVGTRKRAYKAMRVMGEIWNAALKERNETYEQYKENPEIKPVNSYYSQYHLIRKRDHPEYAKFNAQSMQDVLAKLDSSYKSFFSLIKKDPTARSPREKNIHRCLVYRQSGWKLEGNNLFISNIGKFRLRLHRPIGGRIKSVSITVSRRGFWYISFSCEVPDVPELPVRSQVRIEFPDGLFIRDSRGQEFEHPQFYFTHIERLRRLSRALSRKKKGSRNRKKARRTLAKFHEHIKNKRKYFLEQVANYYVRTYDLIRVPEWPAKEKIMHATNSRTAMKFCDAAYALFLQKLDHAAKKSGKKIETYQV